MINTDTGNRLPAEETFRSCENFFKGDRARETAEQIFLREYQDFSAHVMVLDDDPTGIQTVHGCYVVSDWEKEILKREFEQEQKLFFVLTNSRSFSEEKTRKVHEMIAENAAAAAAESGTPFMIISRGDSTLRGHFPLETRVLRESLSRHGLEFSGEILCPYFKEGGRFTIDGVHYVKEGNDLVPAGQTEFAKDKTFGYSASRLADYIEEKTRGAVPAEAVITITLKELRSLDLDALEEKLDRAQGFHYIAVDAIDEIDVKIMATLVMRMMKKGKHYLYRSAAAVCKVFGNIPDRPLLSREELIGKETDRGGMVIVGSHVRKTTDQLNCLKEAICPMTWIEFHVNEWEKENGLENEAVRCAMAAEAAMEAGKTAVVYTSRQLIAPKTASKEEMLAISVKISDALTSVVGRLTKKPRFLIAKGGITSSDVGTKALAVKRAYVSGQAQPGIPVWRTGEESRFPGISYIIFPGNVGTVSTLRTIVEELA